MSLLVNSLLLLLTTWLVAIYCKKMIAYLPIIFVVLYQSIWLIVSSANVEQGVYLTDTQQYAYFNLSTLRLVILTVLFYSGTLVCRSIIRRYRKEEVVLTEQVSSARELGFIQASVGLGACILSCIAVTILLYVNIMLSGSILSNPNITRFNFYTDYSRIPVCQYIGIILPAIFLFCGLVINFCRSIASKFLCGLIAVLLFLYLWLVGNEATAFMTNGIYFVLPWLISVVRTYRIGDAGKKALRRAFVIVLVIVLLVLAVKYSAAQGYSIYGAEDQDSFSYRLLSLQANIWWNIDRICLFSQRPDFGQLGTEIAAFFGAANGRDYGIWYLMAQAMPSVEFSRYVLGNGTLNAGYPAINISIYGYFLGGIVTFIDGIIFFLFVYYLNRKIINRQYIVACIAIVLFVQEAKVVTMGGVWYLGNLVPMGCMFLLLYWEFINSWANRRVRSVRLERKTADRTNLS